MVPSLRCDSCPSHNEVGGFFLDFERVSIQSHTGTHHTQALHDAYGGPKEIIVAEGDHNTLRSAKSLLAIGSFLKKELAPDSTRDAGEAVDAFKVCRGGRGRQIRDVGYGPDAVDALRSKIDGTLGGQKESRGSGVWTRPTTTAIGGIRWRSQVK